MTAYKRYALSNRHLSIGVALFCLISFHPPIALSQVLDKILMSSHIGEATIVNFANRGTDKPFVQFQRKLDDITETCARELASDNPNSSKKIAECVQTKMKDRQPIITRRAWCSRSTVYTEFGNFSLIAAERETPSVINGSVYKTIRTDWKDHRTEQLIGNCSGCNTPQILDTFRVLCPVRYDEWFSGHDPY